MISIFLYLGALLLSLFALWFAGDLSVKYSVQTASKFNLTSLFVGFVLIAVATGLPELSVTIASFFESAHGISAGTILGSNVCDISLVLGLAILFGGTIIVHLNENKESLIMLLITALAMGLVFALGELTKITGIFLIIVYFVSIYFLWKNRTKKFAEEEKEELREVVDDKSKYSREKYFILLKLAGSISLVLITSEMAVRFAIKLTKLLSLSLETVGSTIFAIGTSLPELSLALNAVKKKEYALVLGNSLGSVLEQGTLLLGILALGANGAIDIRPLRSLAPFMFISFGILAFGMIKRRRVNMIEGVLMLLVYIVYIIYQFVFVG